MTRSARWFLASLGAALLIGACASPDTRVAEPIHQRHDRQAVLSGQAGFSQVGLASWYGGKFHGRQTASGERYDMNAMTAAHRSLPFGTRVRVTDLATRRSVVVRINDRGPFIDGRIVDLSRRAAGRLGMIDRGTAKVRLTVVQQAGG